ncbi:MAG: aspartate carbamoyltransferase [Candidatus Bipolaricaulaceae bacterium]
MGSMQGVDVLRADQFARDELELIMAAADEMDTALERGDVLGTLRGKILAALFFEPSTRTRLSFEAAMLRLGGRVVSVADAKTSSAAKGESLPDTIRTVEGYADVVVLRHPLVGAAEQAAAATHRPVINAGDGAGQHPTQALLDLYTIRREKGRVDGLTVALAGDLKHGRTVHSLAQCLSHYEVTLILASPAALRMPADIVAGLNEAGVRFEETEDLRAAVSRADVLYMTRVQRERFADPAEYERLKGAYVLTKRMLEEAGREVTVMHPLPRVDEIAPDVDGLPGAAYFRQAANGVPVRMALLALICGKA